MARPELTSTLTIIDKSSNVLEAIGNQADKTSVKIDKLIASLELFGKTDSSKDVEKSMKDAARSLDQFESALNSITKSPHEVKLSIDSSSVERQVRNSVEKIKNTISDDFISQLEQELASTPKRNSDDDFISSAAHDAAMKQIENTFNGIEKLFGDMNSNLEKFDKAAGSTIKRNQDNFINKLDGLGFAPKDLNQIKEKLGKFKSSIIKPFSALQDVGFKMMGAVGALQMMLGRLTQVLQLSDRNISQISRFKMLANAEGKTGITANTRSETMRKRASKIASSLGVDAMEFNDQLMGFANNAAFKSFEEAAKFATILNKSFKAAGTGVNEAESAVRQLLQGLSKGKLQGEDLMSILSAAPQVGALLEQAVARLDGKSIDAYKGKVRDLATEGRLTAKVIKEAFFGASEQINKDFKTMPQTFETQMTKLKNSALEAFQPALKKISQIIDSEGFKGIVDFFSVGMKKLGAVAEVLLKILEPVINAVGIILGGLSSGKAFKRDFSYKKGDNTEKAVTNQTALQKLSYQKIYDAQLDQLDAMQEESSILKGMSETQKKYYQTAGAGLGTYRRLQDNLLENIEEEMINNFFKTDPEYSKRFGYDKESDSFKKDITWEDYNLVRSKYFGDFQGNNAIQFHSMAELEAVGDKIYEKQQKIEALKELKNSREFEIYTERVRGDTAWQRKANGMSAESFNDKETQDRFNAITAEAMKATGTKKREDLAYVNIDATIDKIMNQVDVLIKNQSVVNSFLSTAFAENNKFAEGTEKNTRSVHINRDDIEFMKSMTTAEVINRYNTLSSSIVQNNHFAQPPTSSTFGGITASGIQAAANSTLALIGA